MPTYVVFDSKSGRILATHTEYALSGEPEPVDRDQLINGYRQFPGQDVDPSSLDILEVDVDLLRRGLGKAAGNIVVDLESRTIVERRQ
jgi:hypothetical protein